MWQWLEDPIQILKPWINSCKFIMTLFRKLRMYLYFLIIQQLMINRKYFINTSFDFELRNINREIPIAIIIPKIWNWKRNRNIGNFCKNNCQKNKQFKTQTKTKKRNRFEDSIFRFQKKKNGILRVAASDIRLYRTIK